MSAILSEGTPAVTQSGPITIPGTNKQVVLHYAMVKVEHQWGQCDVCEKWRMLTQETGRLIGGDDIGFKCSDLQGITCSFEEPDDKAIPRNLDVSKRREIYSEFENACVCAYRAAEAGKALSPKADFFRVSPPHGAPDGVEPLLREARERLLAVNPHRANHPEEVKLVTLMRLEQLFHYLSLPLPSAEESAVE